MELRLNRVAPIPFLATAVVARFGAPAEQSGADPVSCGYYGSGKVWRCNVFRAAPTPFRDRRSLPSRLMSPRQSAAMGASGAESSVHSTDAI